VRFALTFVLLLAAALVAAPSVASATTPETSAVDEVEGQLTQIGLAIAAGRLIQAEAMLASFKAGDDAPYKERYLLARAELAMASGDAALAEDALAQIGPEASDGCRYGGLAGWVAYQQQDWNRAIAKLGKSVASCADDPGRWNLLGLALMRKGEAAASIAAFNTALSLLPDDNALLNNRGLAYAYSGNFAAALADLERAFGMKVDSATVAGNLTFIRANLGLDPGIETLGDPAASAAMLAHAGDGADAALRPEAARSYYAQAVLLSDRFDGTLWAKAQAGQKEMKSE
jgi:Flp pilus assembly protein TadD